MILEEFIAKLKKIYPKAYIEESSGPYEFKVKNGYILSIDNEGDAPIEYDINHHVIFTDTVDNNIKALTKNITNTLSHIPEHYNMKINYRILNEELIMSICHYEEK